jgi:hypothetical protein
MTAIMIGQTSVIVGLYLFLMTLNGWIISPDQLEKSTMKLTTEKIWRINADIKSVNGIEVFIFQNRRLEMLSFCFEVMLIECSSIENVVLWLSDAEIEYGNVNLSIILVFGNVKAMPTFISLQLSRKI